GLVDHRDLALGVRERLLGLLTEAGALEQHRALRFLGLAPGLGCGPLFGRLRAGGRQPGDVAVGHGQSPRSSGVEPAPPTVPASAPTRASACSMRAISGSRKSGSGVALRAASVVRSQAIWALSWRSRTAASISASFCLAWSFSQLSTRRA